MSRSDRHTIKALQASHREHGDSVVIKNSQDETFETTATFHSDIEVVDEDGGVLHKGDAIGLIKQNLPQRVKHGDEVTLHGDTYTVGIRLKDTRFTLMVAVAK